MSIIRAEIRNWWRNGKAIEGQIYKDTGDIYDDGDDIILLSIRRIEEGSTFFLVETDNGIYKLEKDERKINGV